MGLLYTKMKIFHYKDKLDSLPAEQNMVFPPLHIRVKPTNICNHNCWYCGYRKDNIQLGRDMSGRDLIPQEKMLELVDDFAEMGVKAVTFSGGGDPHCYPHLTATVRRLSASNIKFSCLTNGSRLTGEIAELFAHQGTWIRISMDGWDGPSYAAYRGVSKREFGKMMGNLENFKKLGGPCYLSVVIVVDEKNAIHVYEIIKNLKAIGVNSVKVAPCLISDKPEECNTYQKPHLMKVADQVERAMTDFNDRNFEIFNSYQAQLETFDKDYQWCPYIQINPVIGADLNVYTCHDKAYNLDEGLLFSVKKQRFKDVWSSNKPGFFKINPMVHCKHHCAVNEKNQMILEYLNVDKGHVEFV